jgi:hypothetical protein
MGACITMANKTPSNTKKKYAIKAISEWLSRSTEEEIGLMDVVVLEELIEQARDSEETPSDLSD